MTGRGDRPGAPSSFLGRGWSFPPTFLRETGSVTRTGELDKVKNAMRALFCTEPGERLMRPDYGCDLRHLLFEPLDTPATAYVRELVERALLKHEPRVRLLALRLRPFPEEGRVDMEIEYEVGATNPRQNFVFPYYLREATGAPR